MTFPPQILGGSVQSFWRTQLADERRRRGVLQGTGYDFVSCFIALQDGIGFVYIFCTTM